MSNKTGRLFLVLGVIIFCFILVFDLFAFADEISVAYTMKNIPLSDTDPAFKDFYLTGTQVSSLKKNQVVFVYRNIGIKDSSGTQIISEIKVKVGQLKIISVQSKVAVARQFQLTSRENEPTLEQPGIMTGDYVDLDGAYIDKASNSAK